MGNALANLRQIIAKLELKTAITARREEIDQKQLITDLCITYYTEYSLKFYYCNILNL